MGTRQKLTKSSDRILAGVCAGIAEFFGWSTPGIRFAYLVLTLLTGIVPGVVAYSVLALVMPGDDGDLSRFNLSDYRRQ